MVKYRFAIDSADRIIDAEAFPDHAGSSLYWCVSCGQELIAKVKGKIKRPHFAHKHQVECNGETYLHRLAKLAFLESYSECLREDAPFLVSICVPKYCDRFKQIISCFSRLPDSQHEYDLTSYYQQIDVETREGSFVPDIMLKSKSRPDEKVFVEIAVTHFLSEAKSSSGHRIIEIPVETEDQISVIRSKRLTSSDALFVGFAPSPALATNDECRCASAQVYCFYVFESGKSFMERAAVATIHAKLERRRKSIIYYNIFIEKPSHDLPEEWEPDFMDVGYFDLNRGGLFVEQVLLASSRRVPIRNCFLCRYHGDNWDGEASHSIYCKTYRKTCNSNEASTCDRYRLSTTTA